MMTRPFILAIALLSGAAQGAELGRLFFTPAQRATLDNARRQNIRAAVGSDNDQAATPAEQSIRVNGMVQRSDGRNTVWLNNRAVTDRQSNGVDVSTGKNDGRVRLSVPDSGRSVDLKVGQTAEMVSGTIAESYARRPAVPGAVTGSNAPPVKEPLTAVEKKQAQDAQPR